MPNSFLSMLSSQLRLASSSIVAQILKFCGSLIFVLGVLNVIYAIFLQQHPN